MANENPIAKIGILIILLGFLLFVVVYFNVVSCGSIHPALCDIQYYIIAGGKPSILIVHSDKGMGNPELLYSTLRSPRFSSRVSIKELDTVSLPELKEHQLVIVERAREMCTSDLKMFMDYVNSGGKLIWIGDAGTEKCANEEESVFLVEWERHGTNDNGLIGPWARKDGDKQVSMDILLGVNYKANYCELGNCGAFEWTGNFDFVDTQKTRASLVYGLGQGLKFYGDFSIVQENSESYQATLAFLDFGAPLVVTPAESRWLANEKQNLGKTFPLIVSSGVGNRVAYYAFAPEFVVSDEMPLDEDSGERIAYWAMLENMYYGMLYK